MFRRGMKTDGQALSNPSEFDPAIDPENRIDLRLIENARTGDLPSFNTLVTRHERSVFNVCYRMLRDGSLAEDAAQDTFVKAWQAVNSFQGGIVRPWLLRIATNRCYDILRAQGRRPASSLDAELVETEPDWTSQSEIADPPETHAARNELSATLERVLGALPDELRLLIVLADVQGYPYDEIAAITGNPMGTVKSRIFRARAKLRELVLADPSARELLQTIGRFSSSGDDQA
jgi:RNA polymerase sigma-70 factor, ECF subfamily